MWLPWHDGKPLSERNKESWPASLSVGSCTFDANTFYSPRLKTNTLLWSWSRGLSVDWRLRWKGLRPNLFHLLFVPYLFFCFPNIAKWHQSELCFSGELISWNAQAGDAENGNLFRDGGWDKRARCFLKSASLVRAKLSCWVSKIPGSHLLKVYFWKSGRNLSKGLWLVQFDSQWITF